MESSVTPTLVHDEAEPLSITAWSPAGDTIRLSPAGAPLFSVRAGLSAGLWRIGPAWVVVAGALHARPLAPAAHVIAPAAQVAAWNPAFLLPLLSAVVLADAVWGIFWHVLRHDPHAGPATAPVHQPRLRLPYARPDAPAGRLLRWLQDESQPGHALQSWPLALLLSVLLAPPLGRAAVGLTLAVIVISLLGLAWARRRHAAPASLLAVLSVTLPWLLGQALVGPITASTLTPAQQASAVALAQQASPVAPAQQASAVAPAQQASPVAPAQQASPVAPAQQASAVALAQQASPVALVVGFTLLMWGMLRCQQQAPLSWLMPAGLVVVIAALVLQPAPIAAGLAGILGLIPFWRGLGRPASLPAASWSQVHPWLLASLLAAAAA